MFRSPHETRARGGAFNPNAPPKRRAVLAHCRSNSQTHCACRFSSQAMRVDSFCLRHPPIRILGIALPPPPQSFAIPLFVTSDAVNLGTKEKDRYVKRHAEFETSSKDHAPPCPRRSSRTHAGQKSGANNGKTGTEHEGNRSTLYAWVCTGGW